MCEDDDVTILVNVFELEPDKLDEFLTHVRERADFMSTQPGFCSLRILRALSVGARFQVEMIAEWASMDALRAAVDQVRFQDTAHRVVESLGVVAHPGVYRVALDIRGRKRS
jgi:heme-degrading monooxygenase HmoA